MRQEAAGTVPDAEAYLTLTERVTAARAALAENSERLAAAAERLRVTRYSLATGRSQREQLLRRGDRWEMTTDVTENPAVHFTSAA